jgi:hypothetical protein
VRVTPKLRPWRLALTAFALTGLTGFVLGAQQFFVKFLHDQAAHIRTIWGLLFLLLAVIGPTLPLLLISKREAFLRLRQSSQWTAALTIPVLYATALGVCMLASTYTKGVVIGRPGLRMHIRMDPGHPDQFAAVEMHGLRRELPSSQNWPDDRARHSFDFVGYQTYLRFPRDVTMKASGTAWQRADGNVEIAFNFDSTEAFHLQLEGLANVRLTQGGEVVSNPLKFRPGAHRIDAIARPQ